jgi:hypothetical protein
MSALPVDLEIAVNRWQLAERLNDLVADVLAQDVTAESAPWQLGQVIGRLDFLIAELNGTEVTL